MAKDKQFLRQSLRTSKILIPEGCNGKETWMALELGNTNTCAAIFINGEIEILKNRDEFGNETDTTPTVLGFLEGQDTPVIGAEAVAMATKNKGRVIFDFVSLLGRDFDSEEVDRYR